MLGKRHSELLMGSKWLGGARGYGLDYSLPWSRRSCRRCRPRPVITLNPLCSNGFQVISSAFVSGLIVLLGRGGGGDQLFSYRSHAPKTAAA